MLVVEEDDEAPEEPADRRAATSDERAVADGCLTSAAATRVAATIASPSRCARSSRPARRSRRPSLEDRASRSSATRSRPRSTTCPAARRYLGKGLDLRTDAVVCRRLVATSCAFQGTQPATALDLVRSRGSALGPVVVVNVGYNDWAAVYDVDKVMRALKAARVRTVVWVTLREATSN